MLSELGKKMLLIAAKLGHVGADREFFFHHIRGIRYHDLEKELLILEMEDYITIEWVGPSNFTVFITPKGNELAESYQEEVQPKSAETLGDQESFLLPSLFEVLLAPRKHPPLHIPLFRF